MRSTIIGAFLLGAICITFVSTEDKLCKDAVNDILKFQLNLVTNCLDQLGYEEPKERAAKMSCVLKCVLKAQGILGEDGFADPIETLKFLEKSLPEANKQHATGIIMGCQSVAVKVDPNEESCRSYDNIVKCAMNAMNKFCD